MKQRTLCKTYSFNGKGLHTGCMTCMTVSPAPAGNGIVFKRADIPGSKPVKALASNVSSTARSTTLSDGVSEFHTVEHILSALTGLGIDNATIELDNAEVPILDGSAKPYVDAICPDGTCTQEADRSYIDITEEIEIKDEESGSYIRITPSDKPEIDITVDFGSRVLGVQSAHWDETTDYASQIGQCRTFVFFHEIEFLARQGLVKGGDVDNAIIVVEHPVTDKQVDELSALINRPKYSIDNNGYLNNLTLRFPDECGRHKMLDIIGDLRLSGGWVNAKISAFKPGHSINTRAALAILNSVENK